MMKGIKKILACVDLSEYSLITLEYALEFARGTGAEILVLNVLNQRDKHAVEMAAMVYSPLLEIDGFVQEGIDSRFDRLGQLIDKHFYGEISRMTLRVEMGTPYDIILKTAEKEGVDLIVMANKGRSNLSRILLGSAAEKVFRHSTIPVVSVRDKKTFKRGK